MDHDGSMGRVLRFCEWIMRFAYTNLLWLVFTLLGLGVFGVMPATAALFAVMRKWIQGQDNVPVLKTFWREYKAEFFRSNLIGAVLAIIGLIIYIDLAFIYPSHFLLHVLRFAIMIFGFLFVSMLFYVFPLLVHFDWKKTSVCEVFALAQCGVFAIYTRHACADCRSPFLACVPAALSLFSASA